MRKHLALALLLICLFGSNALAVTPAIVRSTACPNSLGQGAGSGGNTTHACSGTSANTYCCPFEATISGNTLVVHLYYDNTGGPQGLSLSDTKGDTFTSQVISSNSANGNAGQLWTAINVAAGNTWVAVKLTSGSSGGFWQMTVDEVDNVTAFDKAHCNSGTSASITAGSLGTLAASGDLILQSSYADSGTHGQTFTAGSQTNITWAILSALKQDSAATQWGVYSVTTALNPTFTQSSSTAFLSCAIALEAGASGGQPSSANIYSIHTQHEQAPSGTASPWTITFPTTGASFVNISYIGGGTTISSISSSPSCPGSGWQSSGTAATQVAVASQDFYCLNSSFSGTVTITVTLGASTSNDTYIVQDFAGPGTWSLDTDSGGQSGNQGSVVTSFTTCSSCITPASANELIFINAGWNFCTAYTFSAPSGGTFDTATFNYNQVDGPEAVDQNNGWVHFYNSSTSAISGTWTMACGATAESQWAGRAVAFKSPAAAGTTPITNKRRKLDQIDPGGM